MMIRWNDKSFDWLMRASEYTGFSRRLAGILLRHIDKRGTLCDIGCGMGMVDTELAGKIGHVTCVDIDSAAADFAETRAKALNVGNLTAECRDARTLSGRWDTVTSIFHGETEDYVKSYLRLADDRFIAVVHGNPKGTLGPEKYRSKKRNFAESMANRLSELGVNYYREDHKLEYGQPFSDMGEAADFAKAYSLSPPDATVNKYLEETLIPSGSEKYPLYLPNEKHFAVFVIRRRDNEIFYRGCAPCG